VFLSPMQQLLQYCLQYWRVQLRCFVFTQLYVDARQVSWVAGCCTPGKHTESHGSPAVGATVVVA
jgi:hypothetical protein